MVRLDHGRIGVHLDWATAHITVRYQHRPGAPVHGLLVGHTVERAERRGLIGRRACA